MNLIDAAIIIEAQAKLIKQQALDITDLEHQLEQREYNKRYTNTKFVKAEVADPKYFNADSSKPFAYINEATKLKRKSKK